MADFTGFSISNSIPNSICLILSFLNFSLGYIISNVGDPLLLCFEVFLSLVNEIIWNLGRGSVGPVGLLCILYSALVKAEKPALQLVFAEKLAL